MPLDHSKATATISVKGLALGCYNQKTSNWEVAFLRHPEHILSLNVTRQSSDGPARIRFQLDNQHSIEVEGTNATLPQQPLFISNGSQFNRQGSGNDPEDLRWIVDIERELNDGKAVDFEKAEFPITSLFVSRPTIYANSEEFVQDVTELVSEGNTTLFGKVAEAANADINCDEGGAVILKINGPLGFTIKLPHIPGSPHTIEIHNMRPPQPNGHGTNLSDFKLYYDIVKGKKFDLRKKGGVHGPGAICNKAFLGVRDQLFPLP